MKFFRKPWFWILLLDVLYLLIAVFFALSFALFPDAAYSDWEEFYITKWCDSAILPLYSLFTFLISLACCIITPFLRKTAVRAKAASMFIYLLLALFSLSFLMPSFGAAREPTRRISCGSNLRQIQICLRQYAEDFDGFLPPDLPALFESAYLSDAAIYRCPSRWESHTDFSDYLYYGADRRIDEKPPFILLKDHMKNHPGKYNNIMLSNGNLQHERD
mgnify:CR=1 FL=1